jgi:hypothetical protein
MPTKFLALTVFAASITLACRCSLRLSASPPAPAAPSFISEQAPQKPPVTPIVRGVELHPAKTLLVQPCPAELIFHGEITTARPTSVTYTWVDSRGRTWPEHHRKFSLAGVNAVTHKWKVGKPGKPVDAWVQLKVISPESRVSSRVPVHFTCAK